MICLLMEFWIFLYNVRLQFYSFVNTGPFIIDEKVPPTQKSNLCFVNSWKYESTYCIPTGKFWIEKWLSTELKNPTGISFFFPLYIFYAYLPGALY